MYTRPAQKHSLQTSNLVNDTRGNPKLLGHNSSITTEIYTFAGIKSIEQIRRLFDDL
jgi:site-specific recombinase XerC